MLPWLFAMVDPKGRFFCMELAAAQLAMVPPIPHVLLFRVHNNPCSGFKSVAKKKARAAKNAAKHGGAAGGS